MSFCPSCGSGVQAGGSFCASCGASLRSVPPPAVAARVRPTGVAILAVLQFIGAALAAIGGVVLVQGGGALATAGATSDTAFEGAFGGFFGPLLFVVGFAMLIGAALCFLVGRGLWTGRSWARIVWLVFAWIGAVGAVNAFVAGLSYEPAAAIVGLVILAFYGSFIWYFMRPGVKSFFES